jgi:hypothetical protein
MIRDGDKVGSEGKMTSVYCDCEDCYNNDDGRCELDTISMTGRMTGGGWFTLCDDYQEINREDFESQESEVES